MLFKSIYFAWLDVICITKKTKTREQKMKKKGSIDDDHHHHQRIKENLRHDAFLHLRTNMMHDLIIKKILIHCAHIFECDDYFYLINKKKLKIQ